METSVVSLETTRDTKNTITLFDRANSQLQNAIFFNIVNTISYVFSPAMNKSLHAVLVKTCMAPWNVARLSCHCHHCWNAPPTASLCSHPLRGLHKHSASGNECQWVQFFSTWRNPITQFCFIHASMSDSILSDCPSVTICCTATKCNRILLVRFNFYCHITNILW